MKNEIIIPVPKEEDIVAANMRRDNYSRTRDIQAQEFNQAIISRLKAEAKIGGKCEKCGKELNEENGRKDSLKCQACS